MNIFNEMESEVQSYARSFPVVFNKAKDCYLYGEDGKQYIDFLSGAGSLNYGHNNDHLKQALLDYISEDGITHGLDMHSSAKARFLEVFRDKILTPRDMEYVLQFTGPTGTNAVEAALKIARKVTGRNNVISFTNGFHGCSLGAVAATGNQHHRGGAGVSLSDVDRMPFCGYYGRDVDTVKMIDKLLSDPSSGIDKPACAIVEAVQGEGGLNVATTEWLQALEKLCKKHEILLILDDIQAGCGRTGTFFSFEPAGIKPDIVTLSKSLSAYGLPFAVVMIKPDLDIWEPGEHNGTFRGNNHAFVTATAAIEHYWSDDKLENEIKAKAQLVTQRFKKIIEANGELTLRLKGRGLMQGIDCGTGELASKVCAQAFEHGVVIETSGNHSQIVKCFCPLTISEEALTDGLNKLEQSFAEVFAQEKLKKAS
ncbi:diaminobutyrate--2-oxoglutarate transaminase [Gilvimarinus xylanilyticus]|uniref:Diaminobutyrate--2-oxoglutarate transaminase n=1 Tax=Gilvimarinus xylanilyticus TaxID=2944139 RepID=A0A9X2I437_9GAMM|nr:diaminobutyrate--2-oxoglutarate transaminase [Gilvimarinus xylanilyticus]MCP8898592.1 diaminobutyrate--2-oxoglutarate transaminase [Gilvimarinus xylanilyticus]